MIYLDICFSEDTNSFANLAGGLVLLSVKLNLARVVSLKIHGVSDKFFKFCCKISQ